MRVAAIMLAAAANLCVLALAMRHELHDEKLRADILTDVSDANTFGVVGRLSRTSGASVLTKSARPAPTWRVSFVTEVPDNVTNITSLAVSASRSIVRTPTATRLDLMWSGIPVTTEAHVDVTMSIVLQNGLLEYELHVSSTSAAIGLWSWSLSPIAGVVMTAASATFQNKGFGIVHSPPASFSGVYPSATMQWMAALSTGSSADSVYVGAHDSNAESKTLTCTVTPQGTASESAVGSFSVSATPPNAGVPLKGSFRMGWPLVFGVFEGSSWWDAAQLYRGWVLPNAAWTQQGPLTTRTTRAAPEGKNALPAWLFNLTTWINSNWQGNDIFNISGGDPAVVANRVSQIAQRFGLAKDALALHWYEWDTLGYELGSNYTVCESEVTCGFDTHYPEYFPPRKGFNASLASMQALGVRVAPYINGRIFDKATSSLAAHGGIAKQSSSKMATTATLSTPRLSTYDESYGSKAEFAVMCPATAYWQDTIADVVERLVMDYGEHSSVVLRTTCTPETRTPCWHAQLPRSCCMLASSTCTRRARWRLHRPDRCSWTTPVL